MALSAKDKSILVRVKVQRAKTHLANLESEIIPYRGLRRDEMIKMLTLSPESRFPCKPS
jgi:hypothetical protein